LIQHFCAPGSVELGKRPRQHTNIRDGQVHSLRAGGRDNVSGVAREKQSAELHGLNYETAHPGNAFFEDRSFGRSPAVDGGVPRAKFFPDPRIRPLTDILIGRALQIETGDLGRSHAEQREAAFVIRVNRFLRSRRRLRQDAEPRERVNALEDRKGARRDRSARNAVPAVAPGHEIALDLLCIAKPKAGDRGVQVMQAHAAYFKMNLASGVDSGLDQIFDHFLLAIHRDGSAGSEIAKVDAMPLAVETQLNSVMNQPFFLQPRAYTGFNQQIDGALLQHARANAFLHILARVRFEHN
jgi:hypothetical protein